MDNKYVLEWFRLADNDLTVAEFTLANYPAMYEIICYHCQQSAEKYLKGYLTYNGIKPPKTHEVDKLCEMCMELNTRFNEKLKICATLTMYGVQPRYPYESELDEYHAKQAVDYAQKIRNFEPLAELREKLKTSE